MSLNLEAMELIRLQMAKYARHLDTKEFDKWEAIFKPEAKIIFYNVDGTVMYAFNSIGELAPATRGMFATAQTIHQTHNSEIEFHSDTEASAIWSMEDWHVYASQGDAPPKTMHGYGFFHTEWELIDNVWKLAKLELRRNILFHT